MSLQEDARDHVVSSRKHAETDLVIEIVSAIETLGTAVEVIQRKLDRLEQQHQGRAQRPERFLSF